MSQWRSAFVTWLTRRRRVAEEWAFHRDAAIAEFERLGWKRRQARKSAKARMGPRLRHRRRALAAIGGDLPGLWRLLPITSFTRSAPLVPAALLAGVVLALALNPARGMAVTRIAAMLSGMNLPAAQRLIPLTPAGATPVAFAGALLRAAALAALIWAMANLLPRRSFRALLYALVVLTEIVVAAAATWVTGIQILTGASWGHDGIQGFALLAFPFGFVAALYVALSFWRADVERRCPYCLRLPGMPETRGNALDLLVNPRQTQSICFWGHGTVSESRWGRCFEAAREGDPC